MTEPERELVKLEMTYLQACVLMGLLSVVEGSPDKLGRKVSIELREALKLSGVHALDCWDIDHPPVPM